jgi:hypothetical protein
MIESLINFETYSREKQHKFDLEIMRRGHFRILITRPIDDFVNIIM